MDATTSRKIGCTQLHFQKEVHEFLNTQFPGTKHHNKDNRAVWNEVGINPQHAICMCARIKK